MSRPPDHSIFIDWPWRYGYLVLSDDELTEVIFDPVVGDWEIRLLARFW